MCWCWRGAELTEHAKIVAHGPVLYGFAIDTAEHVKGVE